MYVKRNVIYTVLRTTYRVLYWISADKLERNHPWINYIITVTLRLVITSPSNRRQYANDISFSSFDTVLGTSSYVDTPFADDSTLIFFRKDKIVDTTSND